MSGSEPKLWLVNAPRAAIWTSPEGLSDVLGRLRHEYGSPEVMITENGLPDDLTDAEDPAADQARVTFLTRQLMCELVEVSGDLGVADQRDAENARIRQDVEADPYVPRIDRCRDDGPSQVVAERETGSAGPRKFVSK